MTTRIVGRSCTLVYCITMKFLSAALSRRVNIKLLIFDCDGIIFDSNNLKTEAYRQTIRSLKVSEAGVEKFANYHLSDVSVSRFVKFTHFFTDMYHVDGASVDTLVEKALATFSSQCLALYSQLNPVEEALSLAERAPVSCVISGGAQTELAHVFKEHNIHLHFYKILGSPVTKEIHLQELFNETGIAPDETLFIGDGFTDFKTARKFGTHFCFLKQMSDWKDYETEMEGATNVTRCEHWSDVLKRIDFDEDDNCNAQK